jgi:hypothetical protein
MSWERTSQRTDERSYGFHAQFVGSEFEGGSSALLYGAIAVTCPDDKRHNGMVYCTGHGKSPTFANLGFGHGGKRGIAGNWWGAFDLITDYQSVVHVTGVYTDSDNPFRIAHSLDGEDWTEQCTVSGRDPNGTVCV